MHNGQVTFASDTSEVWGLYPTLTGSLAFDIGANGGMTARILSKGFTRVVACEPAGESYKYIVEDLPTNVSALNIAVSNGPAHITLRETNLTPSLGELFSNSDVLPWGHETGTRVVPATTLDHLADLYGMPDFLKVDTEGHECEILQGGEHLLRWMSPRKDNGKLRFILEIHDIPHGEWVKDYLDSFGLGYRIIRHEAYRVDSPTWNAHYWIVNT